jgi:hypothetical protein
LRHVLGNFHTKISKPVLETTHIIIESILWILRKKIVSFWSHSIRAFSVFFEDLLILSQKPDVLREKPNMES